MGMFFISGSVTAVRSASSRSHQALRGSSLLLGPQSRTSEPHSHPPSAGRGAESGRVGSERNLRCYLEPSLQLFDKEAACREETALIQDDTAAQFQIQDFNRDLKTFMYSCMHAFFN